MTEPTPPGAAPDPDPWIPPAGTQDAGSPWGPPPTPAPPPPPPPPVPPAAPRPTSYRWVTPVAIAGILVAIVVVIGAVGVAFALFSPPQRTARAPYQAPIPASESPVPIPSESPATAGATCPPECLSADHGLLLVPENSLLGSLNEFTSAIPADTSPINAGSEYRLDTEQWALQSALPDACFPLGSESAVSPTLGGTDTGSTAPVWFLGENDGDVGSMTETARFFPDSASASGYETQLASQVAACHQAYPSVDAAPPLDVATASYVVAGTVKGTTIHLYDIQRDNVIVRWRVTVTGSGSDAAIRHFLHTWVATTLLQYPAQ